MGAFCSGPHDLEFTPRASRWQPPAIMMIESIETYKWLKLKPHCNTLTRIFHARNLLCYIAISCRCDETLEIQIPQARTIKAGSALHNHLVYSGRIRPSPSYLHIWSAWTECPYAMHVIYMYVLYLQIRLFPSCRSASAGSQQTADLLPRELALLNICTILIFYIRYIVTCIEIIHRWSRVTFDILASIIRQIYRMRIPR